MNIPKAGQELKNFRTRSFAVKFSRIFAQNLFAKNDGELPSLVEGAQKFENIMRENKTENMRSKVLREDKSAQNNRYWYEERVT